MFTGATSFNGDLSGWCPTKATSFEDFAYGATSYQGGNLTGWAPCVGSATSMSQMFRGANFTGEAQGWQLTKVTDMKYMFYGNAFFQADSISDWWVGNVEDMSFAFMYATAFNADLSNWDGESSFGTNCRPPIFRFG